MKELGLAYGFIPNYNQSIFPRQVLASGQWCLEYSPAIDFRTIGKKTIPVTGEEYVSLRWCLDFVANLEARDRWTVDTMLTTMSL
jgi:hypothetical protein